ncbi:hypothetical protein BDN72DRAFT_829757 [Pluteus cervinus]|uniref:Uncharacterized protein n=1 Tax=Pluteus cervinus TaxID=181527 RepID=A0ACD3BES9_9AGAR|nr:hypothetical protein BDN72DRAFT_829757 [Pluteus cervinus]
MVDSEICWNGSSSNPPSILKAYHPSIGQALSSHFSNFWVRNQLDVAWELLRRQVYKSKAGPLVDFVEKICSDLIFYNYLSSELCTFNGLTLPRNAIIYKLETHSKQIAGPSNLFARAIGITEELLKHLSESIPRNFSCYVLFLRKWPSRERIQDLHLCQLAKTWKTRTTRKGFGSPRRRKEF